MIELAAESAPGRKKIGTTSRGIGPAYEDKMARSGLRVVDLLDPKLLKTHIEAACAEKNAIAHALFGTDPLEPAKMYEEYADAADPDRAFCHRHVGSAERCDPQGRERDVRRCTRNDARYRSWHISFCDVLVCNGGRCGNRNRRWADEYWHGYRGYEGIRDEGWRRAVPD